MKEKICNFCKFECIKYKYIHSNFQFENIIIILKFFCDFYTIEYKYISLDLGIVTSLSYCHTILRL